MSLHSGKKPTEPWFSGGSGRDQYLYPRGYVGPGVRDEWDEFGLRGGGVVRAP